jgi:NAD/NADP transhydrogenase beta subunit
MRAAKIACSLACVFCLASFIAIIRGIRSPLTGSLFTGHGILAAIGLLVMALVCAVEVYGIHTKARFAWRLGWGILTVEFLRFLVVGGSSALQVPNTDYPLVAFGAVMVGGSAVAVYWGFWWKRQKDYFTAQPPVVPTTGRKELALLLSVAALVLAGVGLISGPVTKYHELGIQAVKQFHEQLAARQYFAIYDAADETLRENTSKTDFVNLLQAVHDKLGDVQDLDTTWRGIAFHGGGRATIALYFDTKFTNRNGTEQFVWQEHDHRVTLSRYQIKSNVLDSKRKYNER